MLREIFGRKRDGVTGDWRTLHNDDIYDLCCSPDTLHLIKWTRLVRRVARMEKRNTYRDTERKPKGKRLLGPHNSKRQDNIKMYLKETGVACRGQDSS